MTATYKRLTLGLGAGLVALSAVAGAYVHAQDQNTNQNSRPFRSGRFAGQGGPGGQGRFGGPAGPMGMLPRLGRELELTDTQKDQLKAIAQSHKDDWQALAERGRAAHQALNQAVTADTVDEGLIRQKSADVAQVEADMAVARARAHAEMLQLLTADQKAKLKTLRSEGRSRK